MMRMVVDTNVVIDAMADHFSPQAKLLQAIEAGDVVAIVTVPLKREYELIWRRLMQSGAEQSRLGEWLTRVEMHKSVPVPGVVIDDEEDRKCIEAAVGGKADIIVSSDRHLLDIGEVGGIQIVTPAEAWRRVGEETQGGEEWRQWLSGWGLSVVIVSCILGGFCLALPASAQNAPDAERQQKEQEIAELTEQIKNLEAKKTEVSEEASVIENQLTLLARRLTKARLELEATQAELVAVAKKKKSTEVSIADLTQSVAVKKNQLRGLIRLLYEKEQTSFIDVWFSAGTLSAVIAEQQAVETLQNESLALMQQLQEQSEQLRVEEGRLAEQQEALAATSRLIDAQQIALDEQKKEQAEFLAQKRDQQVRYEQKIVEARAARQEIEAGLFALKSAGVRLQFSSAAEMAQHASELTGVRPSLLLGVLKIESNMGTNIGSGIFPDDMQPQSREPFLRIAKQLGRDPHSMPISRAPSYGWGGAMGPGQIMPQTWEGIAPRLATLLKKPLPDPYELTDAFVATALLLADKGATTASGEREAVGRYLAGPNWQRFPWYMDRVFAVAEEYGKEGLR